MKESNCPMCKLLANPSKPKYGGRKRPADLWEREFKPIGTVTHKEFLEPDKEKLMDRAIGIPDVVSHVNTLYECTSCGYLKRKKNETSHNQRKT